MSAQPNKKASMAGGRSLGARVAPLIEEIPAEGRQDIGHVHLTDEIGWEDGRLGKQAHLNVQGGKGISWDVDQQENALVLRVMLHEGLRREDIVVQVDQGLDRAEQLRVQLPGCDDLIVSVPGYCYSEVVAKRVKSSSTLTITCPVDRKE
jgi:hypothetical protein